MTYSTIYNHGGFLSYGKSLCLATMEQVIDCPRDEGTIWDAIEGGDILACKDGWIEAIEDDDGEIDLSPVAVNLEFSQILDRVYGSGTIENPDDPDEVYTMVEWEISQQPGDVRELMNQLNRYMTERF